MSLSLNVTFNMIMKQSDITKQGQSVILNIKIQHNYEIIAISKFENTLILGSMS